MSQDDDSGRLADLIDSVADGRSVDWDAAGAPPTDARLRRLFEALQIVERISEVHRSEIAETDPARVASLAGAAVPPVPTDSSVATDWPQAQWGHFELLQKLGEGAFGEVYHARDTWLEHSVALKLLKPPLVDRKRFLHEARTLARIRHPNVVAIHGADEHGGRLGFWMDFIDGPTLAEVVEGEGVRSASEAVIIGQDLCRAMAAVHATGIVHRDIKAQNVIRHSDTGRVILMDFGAGEPMNADLTLRRPTGTPLYMAPELFDGSIATRESDIYALGVLLYYLVTRGYPIHGDTIEELLAAHARGERSHLGDVRPDLPDEFVAVIEMMIAADPATRFHSATEVRKALEQVVAPIDVVDQERKPVTWAHRVYVTAVTVVTTLVALTVSGFVSTWAMAVTFGRGEFGIGSPLATLDGDGWLKWGLVLVVAPIRYIGQYTLQLLAVIVGIRLLRRLSSSLDHQFTRAGDFSRQFLQRRRLDDPNLLLQATACVGALAFAGLALYRWQQANVFAMYIDTAPPESLALLAPANEPQFDVVSRLLEEILFAYGVAAAIVYSSMRRTGVRITSGTKVYVIGVALVAFVMLRAVPFRIVYQNAFPRVDYRDMRCYDLGRRDGMVRLFCPDQNPSVSPRLLTKEVTDPLLQGRGINESVFTPRNQARVFAPTSP